MGKVAIVTDSEQWNYTGRRKEDGNLRTSDAILYQ